MESGEENHEKQNQSEESVSILNESRNTFQDNSDVVENTNKNYEELRKELESINKSLDQLRKTAKKQTLNGDTEKSKKKESADVKKEIDKIPDELKGEQSRFGIVLRSDNHEIKGWKELMTKIDGVIERKEKELKGKKQANSDNDDKIRETIRTYKFRIVKVGGNAK